MRTVGIWISGLLASAIAGWFIGSTFDTVYGNGHGTSDERHVAIWMVDRSHFRGPKANIGAHPGYQ
jgi:hypothetical protein